MSRQPAPVRNGHPPVHRMLLSLLRARTHNDADLALITAAVAARVQLGRERYGVELQPHNGRDATRDLTEELLDACMYSAQVLAEEGDKGGDIARWSAAHAVPGAVVSLLPRLLALPGKP